MTEWQGLHVPQEARHLLVARMMWQNLEIPSLDGFTGFVPPEGTGTYGVALIGEAPGEMEARYGRPFYEQAPAGAVLARLLRRAGLDRNSFVISNAVWSRPPGNYLDGARYEGEAIAAYQPFRERLFAEYRPRVLVALGGVALRTLTPYGGKGTGITAVQGYVLDGPHDGTWVIGALHPSAIMRGEQRMSGCVVWALQRALEIARNGFVRLPTRYVTHPSLDDALAFERAYNPDQHLLSYDIETVESSSLDEEQVEEKDEDISYNITRISLCFSGADGFAISLPWQEPFIAVARRMLGSCGPKRVWNGNFDNPRLAAAQSPVAGRIYDSMWAWKFLQPTLPRSLGFVAPFYNWTGEPWKNTSDAEPEAYSCKDAHALQLIADGVDAHLKQKGQWHVYERHVVELGEVLTRMSHNGLPYDTDKAKSFEIELQAKWDERNTTLQERIPPELKRPKQKQGYKKVPATTTGLVRRKFKVLGQDLTKDELEANPVPPFEIVEIERWCVLEPFVPGSPGEGGQVADLIKHYGYKIGSNRKTKKGSVDDDTLKKLIKRVRRSRKPVDQEFAELLQIIRECRQLNKVLGTYVKGWRPGMDGRIHATPGFWGKMFRISWRRPNISATIQDKTEAYVAEGFRKCVAPQAGRILCECDWRGIEAVLVGWFANDPDYMRLGRLGVHAYMLALVLADQHKITQADVPLLTWSDADISAALKPLKKRFTFEYDQNKHGVHLSNYLGTPFLMNEMFPESFPSLKSAKAWQDFYFSNVASKVKTWHKATLDRASRECKLRNPFGYEMPFWEVFRWDSKAQRYVLGEDAKSAIAFLPRDTAAAMLKEVLLRPAIRELVNSGIVLASTHDSITSECDERDLMQVAGIVKQEMERPVPELGGLSIGVELKSGSAWHESSMETLDLTAEALVDLASSLALPSSAPLPEPLPARS